MQLAGCRYDQHGIGWLQVLFVFLLKQVVPVLLFPKAPVHPIAEVLLIVQDG